jgi:hypothetical protein
VLRIPVSDEIVVVGISRGNILANDAPEPYTEEFLEARLHAELRRGNPPKASESDVTRDWDLLQKAMDMDMSGSEVEAAAQSRRTMQAVSQSRSEPAGGQP